MAMQMHWCTRAVDALACGRVTIMEDGVENWLTGIATNDQGELLVLCAHSADGVARPATPHVRTRDPEVALRMANDLLAQVPAPVIGVHQDAPFTRAELEEGAEVHMVEDPDPGSAPSLIEEIF